jgi:hypothetical protein
MLGFNLLIDVDLFVLRKRQKTLKASNLFKVP